MLKIVFDYIFNHGIQFSYNKHRSGSRKKKIIFVPKHDNVTKIYLGGRGSILSGNTWWICIILFLYGSRDATESENIELHGICYHYHTTILDLPTLLKLFSLKKGEFLKKNMDFFNKNSDKSYDFLFCFVLNPGSDHGIPFCNNKHRSG